MSSDLLILGALKDKQRHRSLRPSVPTQMLGQEAQWLLAWYPIYFEAYPEHEVLDPESLLALIKIRSGYSSEQMAVVKHQIEKLKQPLDADAVRGVVHLLTEQDLSGKAAALITQYQNGGEVELAHELAKLAQETQRTISQSAPTAYVDKSIEEILAEEADDRGLKLPTQALREHVKGLRPGHTMLVGARPDAGKTSLVAQIVTHFAKQVPEQFGDDRPILWLNNEGKGEMIKPRLYQSALGCTVDELWEKSRAGTLEDEYRAALGTDAADFIRIKDMHGATFAQIEQVIEAVKPSVVVWDMMANFRLGGGKDQDRVEATEAKWVEARIMAAQHDFVSIGTCQVSDLGDNVLYPGYNALKDSRTGVQGAVDLMLLMGKLHDPAMSSLRGFSTPKNKRQFAGKPGHVQSEVIFQADICQFKDGGTL